VALRFAGSDSICGVYCYYIKSDYPSGDRGVVQQVRLYKHHGAAATSMYLFLLAPNQDRRDIGLRRPRPVAPTGNASRVGAKSFSGSSPSLVMHVSIAESLVSPSRYRMNRKPETSSGSYPECNNVTSVAGSECPSNGTNRRTVCCDRRGRAVNL